MDTTPHRSSLTIPGAIIVAGALIAVALIWTQKPAKSVTGNQLAANASAQQPGGDIALAPVTTADHILGNPDAAVKIVEYSDPSCPFCKMFDPTMQQIMSEYGPAGKVAWVYRSFPLDKTGTRSDGGILHPNAGREAEAMECIGHIGGNTKFWAYEKAWYAAFPQDGAGRSAADDLAQLHRLAASIGLDTADFSSCLTNGTTKGLVEKQYQSGLNAGVSGTPYSIILTPSGSKIPLVGAEAYATVKAAIDALLGGSQ